MSISVQSAGPVECSRLVVVILIEWSPLSKSEKGRREHTTVRAREVERGCKVLLTYTIHSFYIFYFVVAASLVAVCVCGCAGAFTSVSAVGHASSHMKCL